MAEKNVTQTELQRLHSGGVRGLRFNFVKHLGGTPELGAVQDLAVRIGPMGWHLQLHLDADNITELREFLRKLSIPFIIDHMGRVPVQGGIGQPAFHQLIELLKDNKNAWVKVSGLERISATGKPFHDAIPFAQALAAAAPDRVMWGTDFPHPEGSWPLTREQQLDTFRGLPDAEIAAMLGGNAVELYGFDAEKLAPIAARIGPRKSDFQLSGPED